MHIKLYSMIEPFQAIYGKCFPKSTPKYDNIQALEKAINEKNQNQNFWETPIFCFNLVQGTLILGILANGIYHQCSPKFLLANKKIHIFCKLPLTIEALSFLEIGKKGCKLMSAHYKKQRKSLEAQKSRFNGR